MITCLNAIKVTVYVCIILFCYLYYCMQSVTVLVFKHILFTK
jgi:hypothetical protein